MISDMIIEDLRRDKRVLQDEHNRLLQTVFGENQNKEMQFDRERSLYRGKIQQLEQVISSSIFKNIGCRISIIEVMTTRRYCREPKTVGSGEVGNAESRRLQDRE
jgi:hypothetical protein